MEEDTVHTGASSAGPVLPGQLLACLFSGLSAPHHVRAPEGRWQTSLGNEISQAGASDLCALWGHRPGSSVDAERGLLRKVSLSTFFEDKACVLTVFWELRLSRPDT